MAMDELEPLDRTQVTERIDEIVRELLALRRLMARQPATPNDLTSRLLGSLGTEPLQDYDYDLDWKRFSTA